MCIINTGPAWVHVVTWLERNNSQTVFEKQVDGFQIYRQLKCAIYFFFFFVCILLKTSVWVVRLLVPIVLIQTSRVTPRHWWKLNVSLRKLDSMTRHLESWLGIISNLEPVRKKEKKKGFVSLKGKDGQTKKKQALLWHLPSGKKQVSIQKWHTVSSHWIGCIIPADINHLSGAHWNETKITKQKSFSLSPLFTFAFYFLSCWWSATAHLSTKHFFSMARRGFMCFLVAVVWIDVSVCRSEGRRGFELETVQPVIEVWCCCCCLVSLWAAVVWVVPSCMSKYVRLFWTLRLYNWRAPSLCFLVWRVLICVDVMLKVFRVCVCADLRGVLFC